MKAPEWMHRWLAKLAGPGWKRYVNTGNSLERKARIKEMLEKEKVLKQMAEADKQRVKFGGPGTCPTCGEIVSNLALHAAMCGKWDDFGNPVLSELAEADRESNIRLNRDEELENIRLIRG